jgi:hypothetical protein
MAGQGPAPKNPDERARTHAPLRGEWQTLGPLTEPVLPPLPRRGKGEGTWSARTQRIWEAWRTDWVTGAYGPAEVAMAVELAYIYEDAVRESRYTTWAEARQWMDRLGLTMKGKRDLRLRPAVPEAPVEQQATNGFASLRLVDDGAVAG